jgi:hypothetical protein
MKYKYYLGLLLLASCASSESLVYNNDTYKKVETLKLDLGLDGYSIQRDRPRSVSDYYFKSTFFQTRNINKEKITTLKLRVKTKIDSKKLNPDLFIKIDNDTIHLLGYDYFEKTVTENTTTTSLDNDNPTPNSDNNSTLKTSNKELQLMEYSYSLNDEIARKISSSTTFSLRVYIGEIGIDITPDFIRRDKIKQFFKISLSPTGYMEKNFNKQR